MLLPPTPPRTKARAGEPRAQTQLVLSEPLWGNPKWAGARFPRPGDGRHSGICLLGPGCEKVHMSVGAGASGLWAGHSGAPVTVTFQVTRRPQRDLRPLSQVHTCSGKLDNCSLQSRSPPPPPVQCPCPVCPTPSCRCVGAAGKLGDPGPLTTTEGASRVGHRGWLGPFLIIALDAAYLE